VRVVKLNITMHIIFERALRVIFYGKCVNWNSNPTIVNWLHRHCESLDLEPAVCGSNRMFGETRGNQRVICYGLQHVVINDFNVESFWFMGNYEISGAVDDQDL